MEEIFSNFRASLLHGNAARIQHFDIIFDLDLSPAFWIIFRIENRMIFVAFRPKNSFDTVNSYQTSIDGQFDTDITSAFNVTHGCIQLVKSTTVLFTGNFADIFISANLLLKFVWKMISLFLCFIRLRWSHFSASSQTPLMTLLYPGFRLSSKTYV